MKSMQAESRYRLITINFPEPQARHITSPRLRWRQALQLASAERKEEEKRWHL
jgi:hypothetical protein